jgi:hypothetical protein
MDIINVTGDTIAEGHANISAGPDMILASSQTPGP